MKIAMIGFRGIPHTYGGGDEFVRYLAPGLVSKGHSVIVYCHSPLFTDKTLFYKGVRRIFVPTIDNKWLGQFIHATLSMLDMLFRGVDIIYVHTLPSGVHTIIPWFFRKKIVVNTDGLDWLRDKWGFVGKLYFQLSARVVVYTANELVSDACAIRDYYLTKFRRDSVFIPYGANIESSGNSEILEEFGLNPFEYYLVACRFVPENNIDLIINAFERFGTGKKLVIAGAPNYKSKYYEKCRATLDSRILFLGHINDYLKVKELHCNCYAYLHGHSLGGTNPSLLKALGYGNCVIALNTRFNAEVLLDRYGILFEKSVNDLISKLDNIDKHPEIATKYREIAPERIKENYSWEKIIDDYERLFLKVYGA